LEKRSQGFQGQALALESSYPLGSYLLNLILFHN